MRKLVLLGAVVAVLVTAGTATPGAEQFPDTVRLPNGFAPEGIAISGHTAYVGSIPTGAIYAANLRTGRGTLVVPPRDERQAIGVGVDDRSRVFVAGGPTGRAWVYDVRDGSTVAAYRLAPGNDPTFVNDVVVTPDRAWFTDSQRAFLYRVVIRPDGSLGKMDRAVPLTGDLEYRAGFNVNGIDATPDGKTLVLVQSNTGMLFTTDRTGVTHQIDLGGETLPNGDGILLDGLTLYVVQNQLNQIAVVELSADMSEGKIVRQIRDDDFDIPTTIDDYQEWLYAVNARFGTEPTPKTKYHLVRVPR